MGLPHNHAACIFSCFSKRGARPIDDRGKDIIVAAKLRDFGFCFRIKPRHVFHDFGRICPVGLGEDDVEGDNRCAEVLKVFNHLGDGGTRPWPLANGLQTLLVDIDNFNRLLSVFGDGSRFEHLEIIEDLRTQ